MEMFYGVLFIDYVTHQAEYLKDSARNLIIL